ncbi:MAG TPA: hypothetical protein VGQ89_15705 [Candidatus Limnocylindrales bacterium]|jgi:hypothetical protein|nr:hypothetical protein [Candidatus Limnocylindrales bacterium]
MTRPDVDLDEYPHHRNHLSEAELFRAHGIRPSPAPETIRRRLVDALEAETSPRADRREDPAPADVAGEPAAER